MPWETTPVYGVGGGINVSSHPVAIETSQWSWGDGFIARNGVAEILPQWTQINSGAWMPANNVPIGIFQNPFDATNPALLLSTNLTTHVITLVKMTPAGVATSIPWDSSGATPLASATGICMTAFLNNFLVIATGAVAGGTFSLIRTDGTNFHGINTVATGLSADYLVSFKSALVAGSVNRGGASLTQATQRQFAWSDINTTDTWDAAISNAADSGFLDDLGSGITGMGFISQDTLGLFTAGGIHALQSTGGIPLFTRFAISALSIPPSQTAASGLVGSPAFFGAMPNGSVVKASDNVYLLQGGGAQQIGQNIIRYVVSDEQVNGVANWCGPYLWHKRLGLLLCTRGGSSATGQNKFLYYDPVTGAWSHRGTPGTELGGNANKTPCRQAYIVDTVTVSSGIGLHWWVDQASAAVYRETIGATPAGGEYFDTKDFTFGDPPTFGTINLIRVEWECLTNHLNDQIAVYAAVRDNFAPFILGSGGLDMQNLTFVFVGFLSQGGSELPCHLVGKVVRFRFQQSSGLVRVRGFSFRWRTAGDRPVTSTQA